jgi:hypothetical protein
MTDPPTRHEIATGFNMYMCGRSGISTVRDNVTMAMFSNMIEIYSVIISILGIAVGRTVSNEWNRDG